MEQPPSNDDLDAKSPGGVRRDAHGNAVWEWAGNTGRQMLESTSRLLRKLEVPGLKLLDEPDEKPDAPQAAKKGVPSTTLRDAERGFDPYGGHAASKQSAPKPPRVAPPAVRKPSFLARLFGRR